MGLVVLLIFVVLLAVWCTGTWLSVMLLATGITDIISGDTDKASITATILGSLLVIPIINGSRRVSFKVGPPSEHLT